MNVDGLVRFLGRSNWIFLAGWILLLGAAFAVSFPERRVPVRNRRSGSDQAPLR